MKLLLLSALAVAMAQDFEDFASETRDVTHFVKNIYNFLRHGAMVQLLTPPTGVDWILQNSFVFFRRKIFWRLLKQKIVSVRTDGFTSVETGGYCGGNHAQSA